MRKVSTFKERLKEAMSTRGIRQIELSHLTGINKSLICDYIGGKYEPKQDKLDSISRVLQVSPVWLMGYENVSMDRERELVKQDNRQKVSQFISDMNDESFDKLEDFLIKFFDYKK